MKVLGLSDEEILAQLQTLHPSPAFALLGCSPTSLDSALGVFTATFMPSRQLLNAAGSVHGGQVCAMLDMVTSFAAVAQTGFLRSLVTLELKTSFLAPVQRDTIFAVGRVRQAGGSICFVEGELQQPQGTVVATATATAKFVNRSSALASSGSVRAA